MGDVVSDLGALVPGVRFNERKEWFDTIRGWKKSYPLVYDESKAGEPMKPLKRWIGC